MKKLSAAFALIFLLLCVCSFASAEIRVSRKDLEMNSELDSSVTNVLVLLQDGDKSNTVLVASVNSKTGRAVMIRLDPSIPVNVDGTDVTLADVYSMGDKKSRGFLACRTVNRMLNLNLSTYVAVELGKLPELVETVGTLNMQFTPEEAKAMGTWEGINELTGEKVLDYVRLQLDTDSAARSRGYDALMQLLYQGLHSGDLSGMLSLGNRLLSGLDTNLNALSGMTMVSAVQGGTDRRELALPAEGQSAEDAAGMAELVYKEIYE